MGTTASCADPGRGRGPRRKQQLTVLQRSKIAAWQSAHPNPLRLVLGVDLPDAMPEDMDEIKRALADYEASPTGDLDFGSASDNDTRPSRAHGADFSDGEDSDSSDDRDLGDESFVIPTDFEDDDSFTAGGGGSGSDSAGAAGGGGEHADDGATVDASSLVAFEQQLRAIASDFGPADDAAVGDARITRSAHASAGVAADDTALAYAPVTHQAVVHVRRTRFHHPGHDCLVQARPIYAAPPAAPAFASSSAVSRASSAAPSPTAAAVGRGGAGAPRVAAYRLEAFAAPTLDRATPDTLEYVFILTAGCYVLRLDANAGGTELVDYAEGKSLVFSAPSDARLPAQFQASRASAAAAAAATAAAAVRGGLNDGEDETKNDGAAATDDVPLLSPSQWERFLQRACSQTAQLGEGYGAAEGGDGAVPGAQTAVGSAAPALASALVSFTPLVASVKFLDLPPFSMLAFETALFSATRELNPANDSTAAVVPTAAPAVTLRALAPASGGDGDEAFSEDPLGSAVGAGGIIGGGAELTDEQGTYTAAYDAQPALRWRVKAGETLQADAVAFTTSVYLVDETDGQRYLLGALRPRRCDEVRTGHGADFPLHHVNQYAISVPVDGGLPFTLVDDGDGSGAVCVGKLTIAGGASGGGTDAERLAASPYHMVQPGDHVVGVNGKSVHYIFDVVAGLRQAAAGGATTATLTCAGVRTTAVLSLRNPAQFGGRPVEQLKQLVEDSFARVRQDIQRITATDMATWNRHLRRTQAQLAGIVQIADLVLSYASVQGFDAVQVFWWVQQRAKAFYREGSEFRHAIQPDSGIGDVTRPLDVERKLQWAQAATRAYAASMREYQFLERHVRREFVRRRKFSLVEKILDAQVECLDVSAFLATKLPPGYRAQLPPLQQHFGAVPPAPYHLLAPDQESILDRRGRVWYLLRQLVQLHETYPFEDSTVKAVYAKKLAMVENAIRIESSPAAGPKLAVVVGHASLGMRTEDVREF